MANRRAKSVTKKGQPTVVERDERANLQGYFAQQGQVLLPLLELIEGARASMDEFRTAWTIL